MRHQSSSWRPSLFPDFSCPEIQKLFPTPGPVTAFSLQHEIKFGSDLNFSPSPIVLNAQLQRSGSIPRVQSAAARLRATTRAGGSILLLCMKWRLQQQLSLLTVCKYIRLRSNCIGNWQTSKAIVALSCQAVRALAFLPPVSSNLRAAKRKTSVFRRLKAFFVLGPLHYNEKDSFQQVPASG